MNFFFKKNEMALGFHEGALPSPKDPNVTCISTPPGSILVVFGGLVGGVAIMFLPSYLCVVQIFFFKKKMAKLYIHQTLGDVTPVSGCGIKFHNLVR
jgi:hypothetical protein